MNNTKIPKLNDLADDIVVLVNSKTAREESEDLAKEAMLLAYHRLFGGDSYAALITGHRYLFPSNS